MSRAIPHCCIMWLPHVTIIMHVNILWGSNEDHVDVYIDHFAFSGSLCCSAITAMAFSPNHNQLGIALVYCSMFCRECSILNVAQNMAPFHNHYCTHPQFHTSHIHVHRENLCDLLVYLIVLHTKYIIIFVVFHAVSIGNHRAHLFIAGLLDIQLSVSWTEQDKTSILTNYFFLS